MKCMQVSLQLVLVGVTACLPTEPLPAPTENAQTRFVAVEQSDGMYWVHASNASESGPTVLVDGERRVDVYYYDCPMDVFPEFREARDAAFGRIEMEPEFLTFHPRPVNLFSTMVADGRIGEWRSAPNLVFYPCPRYELAWPDPVHLDDVDVSTAWITAKGPTIYVGSAASDIYEIDREGQTKRASSRRVHDIAK